MLKSILFFILSFIAIFLPSGFAIAQSTTTDSNLELRMQRLEAQADSLRAPFSSKGWADLRPKKFPYKKFSLPENRFFNRIPAPGEEKKKTPIKGFKGWYFEELAELNK